MEIIEEKKKGGSKGLWHNIHQRRKKGLPRKKPGQKGYPKTLDIGEATLREWIAELVKEILKE